MKEKNAKDAALLSKSSLSIKLLPETEEDSKTASLLRLNATQSICTFGIKSFNMNLKYFSSSSGRATKGCATSN